MKNKSNDPERRNISRPKFSQPCHLQLGSPVHEGAVGAAVIDDEEVPARPGGGDAGSDRTGGVVHEEGRHAALIPRLKRTKTVHHSHSLKTVNLVVMELFGSSCFLLEVYSTSVKYHFFPGKTPGV